MSSLKERIEALKKRGPVEIVTAPLLYPTPRWLADKMAELLDVESHHKILEPSAGTGALLDALERVGPDEMTEPVEAWELVPQLKQALRLKYKTGKAVFGGDFLEVEPLPRFDRILMNPPFNGGADIKHVLHALKFLKPGGRLVAIVANGPRQNDKLKPLCESWEVLPAGTFEHAGTMVNCVLMVVQND